MFFDDKSSKDQLELSTLRVKFLIRFTNTIERKKLLIDPSDIVIGYM